MSLNSNTKQPKDKLMQSLFNFGVISLFIVIVVLVYKYVIVTDYQKLRVEGFADIETLPTNLPSITESQDTESQDTELTKDEQLSSQNTIYEKSLTKLYGDNTRLMCSMLPNLGGNTGVCQINNSPVVIYQFPVHMIKLIDGTILAVFNDGRLYQKDSMKSTIWAGPITNSLPQDIIPLRMITLSTDLVTLLGVGYDNNLYMKSPDSKGFINLTAVWKKVPNNSSIIYVLFDNLTDFMISIDVKGKLFTKTNNDISSTNQELVTKLDRPVLRLYYDINAYMLAIDDKFNLYQFGELNWKTAPLNTSRGFNNSKLQDLMYDNDGKLYGLVFNPNSFMVQIMKQNSIFYLSDFVPLDMQLTADNATQDFAMSDQDIIKSKTGSLYEFISSLSSSYNDDSVDNDPNFAYQKQIIENQARLRNFCSNRGLTTANNNFENYDLLASVDQNNDKIGQLKNIINNLMTYEPDSVMLKEKYPILSLQE